MLKLIEKGGQYEPPFLFCVLAKLNIMRLLACLLLLFCTNIKVFGQTAKDYLDSAQKYRGSNFNKTATFAEQSFRLAIEKNDSITAAAASFTAGYGNYLDGNYDAALHWYLEAEQLFTLLADDTSLASTYTELTVFYSRHQKFDAGDSVSLKAIHLALKLKDDNKLANAHNNRGLLMWRNGKLDSALVNLNKAYELYKNLNDRVGLSYSLDYLASVYADKGASEKALDYLYQSRDLKIAADDKMGEAIVTNNIGEALLSAGDLNQAIRFFKEARTKAEALDFTDLEAHTWKMEATALEKQRRFAEAYSAIKTYQEINGKLLNEKKIKAIEELQTRYETEKKEQENMLLQRTNQVQALQLTQRNYAIFALLIIIGLAIGIFYLLYTKHRMRVQARIAQTLLEQQELRAQAVVDAEEHERQRLARELHDGIGQMLAATRRSIQMSAENPAADISNGPIALLDESIREVRQLSHSMMPPSMQNKELVEALSELTERTRYATELNIQTEWVDIDNLQLDTTATLMLYRAIQEILSNIIRHASATQVQFDMVNHGSELNIILYDNGKGFDTSAVKKGIGLNNIRSRIAYLGGTLQLDSKAGVGTTYIIDLPL